MSFKLRHPAMHLIYFAAVITASAVFSHPCFMLCAYLCAFLCNLFVNGKRGFRRNLRFLLLAFLFMLFYSGYNHFGVTNLSVNLIGNRITLESIVRGSVIGIKAATLIMWLDTLCGVMTTDEIVYLFGRIAPKMSLYIAVFLRMLPCVLDERNRIKNSGRSAGISENPVARFFSRMNILVSWTAERLSDSADSMRSRGFTLKGRTAYSIYRFDNRDRMYIILIFVLITAMLAAFILGETSAVYSSVIIITAPTARKTLFTLAYAILLLLPVETEITKKCFADNYC